MKSGPESTAAGHLAERRKGRARTGIWILLGLGLVAALGIAFHTRFGPGASGDSTSYLMGAENLAAGNGYMRYSGGFERKPITGFPPVYSLALAAPIALRADPYQAARWLNVLLFLANIVLVGLWIRELGHGWGLGIIGALLVGLYPEQVHWHSWVMSEPLFTFLSLLSLWFLAKTMRDGPHRWRWLIAAVLLVWLVALTRLVGLALILSGSIWLLLGNGSATRRLARSVLFGGLSAIPVFTWMMASGGDGVGIANRALSFHGVDRELVRLYLAELSSWFVPHELPLPTLVRAGIAVLIAVGVLVWYTSRTRRHLLTAMPRASENQPLGHRLLLVYLASYGLVLAVNSVLLDASTSPTAVPRYLAPAFVVGVIVWVSMAANVVTSAGGSRWLAPAALAYVAGLLLAFGAQTANLVANPLQAIGYVGYRYTWPEVTERLAAIDGDQPIVSNNPELVYVLAERPAYVRPIRFDHYQQVYREDYQQQLEFASQLMVQGAVLVVFHPIEPVDQQFIDYAELQLGSELPQASFYRYPWGNREARSARIGLRVRNATR